MILRGFSEYAVLIRSVNVSVSYLDCRFSSSLIILPFLEILPTFNAVTRQSECIAEFTHTQPEVHSTKLHFIMLETLQRGRKSYSFFSGVTIHHFL